MNERYLTSFEDQTTALGYTSGDTTLVSPQVSLVGADEVVYSKEIPNGSRIRFAKDETTGKLYFIIGGGVYYDALTLKKTEIPVITYGEVDLGLPSGVKWADRNVGAKTPQDYGAYFSWGNVDGVVFNGITKISEDDIIRALLISWGTPADEITQEMIDAIKLEAGEDLKTAIEENLKEYGLISGYSFNENTYAATLGGQYTGSTLDVGHDAATYNMGSDWRMPTNDEIIELVKNTDHYYIGEDGNIVAGPFDYGTNDSDKGLDGSKLRSICFVKKSEAFDYDNRSNFIEFPFAGGCVGSLLDSWGQTGSTWSSNGDADSAINLYFNSGGDISGTAIHGRTRYCGQSIRGVRS